MCGATHRGELGYRRAMADNPAGPLPITPGKDAPVFEEPWEGRAFALVNVMHEQGRFAWSDFQQRLVEEIEAWEASHDASEPYSYYRLWLRALERLLDETALCEVGNLDHAVDALGRETPGHDHVARREPLLVDKARAK